MQNLEPELILGPEGPIAKQFPDYEPRQPQIEMAKAVQNTFEKQRHLFVEAGTGTGKSYAFLIPAIKQAISGKKPVVISTNSLALQEQIYSKDIPDLMKFLNLPHLKVVLRKGRGNYLSLRRLFNAGNLAWTNDEYPQLEDIQTWSETTEVGTLQDLNFVPKPNIWSEVQSDQYDCLGKKCRTYKQCFYYKSRTDSEEADIIITNHSLLTLDLLVKSTSDDNTGILPPFTQLIIDEAHTLEDAIRNADTFEWKSGSAAFLAKRARNKKDNGLLDMLHKMSHLLNGRILDYASQAENHLSNFVKHNEVFFEKDVVDFVRNDKAEEPGASVSKRIKPGNLQSENSANLLTSLAKANIALQAIVSELRPFDREEDEGEKFKEVKQALTLMENYSKQCKEIEGDLKRTINVKQLEGDMLPDFVSSVDVSIIKKQPNYVLSSMPIFVKRIAQNILFSKIPSIVLTSATLTINNQFTFICNNLGATSERTDTLKLGHVFDYMNQVKMILTPQIPIDPYNNPKDRQKYFDQVAAKVEKYVAVTQGNAFILCTSNLAMRELYKRSREKLKKLGMNVMCQGEDLTKEQILHEFKAVAGSVLYAVDSFWTGVDIPGKALQNIIIPKLPFPPPNPLSEAQEEAYQIWNRGKPRDKQRNVFVERTVPNVAIKLQQGFGRLIRRKTDTGIVVLMDQRLVNKPYGKTLLNSLPECKKLIDDSD
jgi:ATP-dependent DNA helicase DinG